MSLELKEDSTKAVWGKSASVDSSGSDNEQARSNASLTDILEDVIGDAPIAPPSEGKCVNIAEEEKEAEVAAQAAKRKLDFKENIAPQNQPAHPNILIEQKVELQKVQAPD